MSPLTALHWRVSGATVSAMFSSLAVLVNVLLVFDELVFHLLFQVVAFGAKIRHPIHDVFHQMKPVNFILHAHVERRSNSAFFLVTTDVEIGFLAGLSQVLRYLVLCFQQKPNQEGEGKLEVSEEKGKGRSP